jgi:glycosyltransferase involved in cell wall biosynthesis
MSEIWMVNHYAITPDQPGGTRHYDLATELIRRGFRVKIFASDLNLALRQHTRLETGQLYTTESCEGVEFVWVRAAQYVGNDSRRAWNMVTFAKNFLRVARRLGQDSRPDVIIGSSPHPLAALAAERAARSLRAHFLLELRDLWPQALLDMGAVAEWHPGVRLMRALERYLYARAERLIILAEGSARYLEARRVPRERIVFLPNGVHLGHFAATISREAGRARYGFASFTIVYTGAHGPANSLETILQAGKQLAETGVEFVLVGDGPAKPGLVQRAQREGVQNVRFLPPVPKAEIPNLLHGADAAVITLKNAKAFAYGVSPNKLFDYMAAARPVICAVPGDMARLVTEAQAGLACAPEDAPSLARAAKQLVAMSEGERAALGRSGRDYLTRHFCREILAARLAEVLAQMDRRLGSAVSLTRAS